MSRMGGACSATRQHRRAWHRHDDHDHGGRSCRGSSGGAVGGGHDGGRRFRLVRHSVESEVKDGSISALYPTYDNYVTVDNNLRSPKSLVDLCVDAVCRSLPDLDGELPPGLPQDLVDAIVRSLVSHSALNATTLRALRNCEIGELSLAGCRGVRDDWFRPLSSRSLGSSPLTLSPKSDTMEFMDAAAPTDMELEHASHRAYSDPPPMLPNLSLARGESESSSSSSSSTCTFVSATSTPFVSPHEEHGDEQPHHHHDPHVMDDVRHAPSAAYNTPNPKKIHQDHPHDLPPSWQSPLQSPSIVANLTKLDLRGSQRLTDRGLLQLSGLTSLEVAQLDHCHSLVGKGLIAFASSPRLHTISLANCRRLTDEAVVNISHLSSLTALSLDGCRCLTDRSLTAISNLYQLRKLDLSQCDLITDDGLEELDGLEFIEELSLGWCRLITDDGLERLCHQPGRKEFLKLLRLARCTITDQGVEHLASLSGLEELDLNGCSSVGSAALGSTLERLPKLTSLDVSYCPGILRLSWQDKIKSVKSLELCYSGVRDNHLARLTKLPALEELNLDSCPVGDWAIAHLADNGVVPNLTSLDLADTDLTDMGMAHLAKFEKMTRLSLFYCNISNAGLRHLSSMTSLEVLNLDSRDIGDEGLSHLRHLTSLRSLDIFSGRVTDLGCVHLSRIKSLESLELCGGGIGDRGCAHLATLENLTSLNLSQNERIHNRGAAALAALSNLKALNLSNTRVNSGALRYFSGLVKLQSLAMYGCDGIDDHESINNLQNDLPSLKCLRLNNGNDDREIWEDEADDVEQEQQEVDGDDMDTENRDWRGSPSMERNTVNEEGSSANDENQNVNNTTGMVRFDEASSDEEESSEEEEEEFLEHRFHDLESDHYLSDSHSERSLE